MAILGWGKTESPKAQRSEWARTNPVSDDFLTGPKDYAINQSSRVLQLGNRDLWIKESGTDWHLPILITLRQESRRNYRQRSDQALKRIAEKKRWRQAMKSRERYGYSNDQTKHKPARRGKKRGSGTSMGEKSHVGPRERSEDYKKKRVPNRIESPIGISKEQWI